MVTVFVEVFPDFTNIKPHSSHRKTDLIESAAFFQLSNFYSGFVSL